MFTAALASALSAFDSELKIILLLMESMTPEQRAALWARHEQRLAWLQDRIEWLRAHVAAINASGTQGQQVAETPVAPPGAAGATGSPQETRQQ